MAVGSIHATDNSSSEAIDDSDDDFKLDEDLLSVLQWPK